ncbi:hypothetical protein [Streptomyces sp. NPDC004629]|uniref:hypothetical protein n=1 Tax=Streptomyces sp. NPDC004629 TaxID=3364705 RepID=UPI0036A9F68F
MPAVSTAFEDRFDDTSLHERWIVPGGEAATTVEPEPRGVRGLPWAAPSDGSDGSVGLLATRVRDLRRRRSRAAVGSCCGSITVITTD